MRGSCNANGACELNYKCAQDEVCVAPDNHCAPIANNHCNVLLVGTRTMLACDFDTGLDFQQATQACQAWPGFGLASVRNTMELNALRDVGDWFGNWIGYVDNPAVSTPGAFVWLDGAAPAPPVNGWCGGQPDNLLGDENCVVMDDGCWHDISCDWDKEGVICSRPDA